MKKLTIIDMCKTNEFKSGFFYLSNDYDINWFAYVFKCKYEQLKYISGFQSSHTRYFKKVREKKINRYIIETNKLLIRLDKLICDISSDPEKRKGIIYNLKYFTYFLTKKRKYFFYIGYLLIEFEKSTVISQLTSIQWTRKHN